MYRFSDFSWKGPQKRPHISARWRNAQKTLRMFSVLHLNWRQDGDRQDKHSTKSLRYDTNFGAQRDLGKTQKSTNQLSD